MSNKKDKHALPAEGHARSTDSTNDSIRSHILLRKRVTFAAIAIPTACLPSHTLSSFPSFYKAGDQPIPHPPSVSLSADSRPNTPTSSLLPWISTGRPQKLIHFFSQVVLLRSHSIVLEHYGELLHSQFIHLLCASPTLVILPGLFRSR